MATEMESFLRAEQSANELLESLEQLKNEVEGYSKAKGSLDDVRNQLIPVIHALKGTAEQSTSVMTALERIGTPEILKKIETVVALNERTVAALERTREGVAAALSSFGAKFGTAIADNIEAIKSTNAATRKQMSEHVGALKQQIDSFSKSIANDMKQVDGRVEQQGKSIKLMIGIGLPLVAVVVAILLLVIRYI